MSAPKGEKPEHVALHCGMCDATVKATVVARHTKKYFDEDNQMELPWELYTFATCPEGHVLLARQNWEGEGDYGNLWSNPLRLWPKRERESNRMIPDIVRVSLDEANLCYRAGAYTASAVMCGRALEGLAAHHKTKGRNLREQLGELLGQGVIDERFRHWGNELRESRNRAAHATGEKISKEDATDLLDFVNAICEYVFVLAPKFKEFVARKESTNGKGTAKKEVRKSGVGASGGDGA